jgi:hypothetical protein
MPSPLNGQQQSQTSIDHLQDTMINVVYNFCSIFTMPWEFVLRPFHGTRYFSPVIVLLSGGVMMVLPLVFSFAGVFSLLTPFGKASSFGFVGMWGLSRLFFAGSLIHGFRKWRLMLHMEKEKISTYEGAPLFFFNWLPRSSFWIVRIVYEPLFLFLLSIVLPNLFILDKRASDFLMLSAFLLAMKQYAAWYMQWQYIRITMDMKFAGPLIARLIENPDDAEGLNALHLASLPKNLPSDIRKAAISHIARTLSPEQQDNDNGPKTS